MSIHPLTTINVSRSEVYKYVTVCDIYVAVYRPRLKIIYPKSSTPWDMFAKGLPEFNIMEIIFYILKQLNMFINNGLPAIY